MLNGYWWLFIPEGSSWGRAWPPPHLHLLQRLRKSGVILPLCLSAFMECTGTTLTLQVKIIKQSKFIICGPRLMPWNCTENLYNQEVLKISLLSHFFWETKYERNANNQVAVIECINQVVLIECINCYAYKEHAAVLVIQFSQHAIAIHVSLIINIYRYNALGAHCAENS